MAEAWEGFTVGPPMLHTWKTVSGRLAEYLADLIVLEKDPFTCVPEDLLAMESFATMVGGDGSGRPKEVYGRPESTYT